VTEQFILSCGSTVDLPFAYLQQRQISVIFYSYSIDDKAYIDDMGRDSQALPRFYEMLAEGKMPSTSQVNEYQYYDYFEALLEKGDVLHIAFGSGMTPSVNNAMHAAETLREKYPHRRLIVIDSLCSSCGYGMLVDGAADLRDAGKSMEEIEAWVLANRQRIHHQFFSTDLKYFRRGGRVSGTAATVGAILNICPIMHLNDTGHIIAYDKVRGKINAIKRTVQTMVEHADNGTDYADKCWICHSNCIDTALQTKEMIETQFSNLVGKVQIYDIGTIIASHCGPNTVAVFFFGDKRISHA